MYKLRPSQILSIENSYDAFCFDEACDYILYELSKEKPETPKWEDEKQGIKEKKSVNDNKSTIEWIMKHNNIHSFRCAQGTKINERVIKITNYCE
ncbi:hypothetical protein [Clostridium sp. BJN0013]|uniref:hypothetical protein n=1 Tax=Clostridium sp. BJN0013 TaxID=3236840 RepID=UPI0034C6C092